MPSIITHHVFGSDVYAALPSAIGHETLQKAAFLLGNIGPDPLFCMRALPAKTPCRNLGGLMHNKRTTDLLDAFHECFIVEDHESAHDVLQAYALGFVCHYLLDSTVHPLVYAQQFAYCDAGIEGLTRKSAGRAVHALIETELDEYVLARKLGVTVASFVPHRETLACPERPLAAISERYAQVASRTYGLDVAKQFFAASVRMYRAAQWALDSKRDGLRRYVDYARLAGKHSLRILAMSHSAVFRNETPFANADHYSWPHPYEEGRIVSESFEELYGIAFEKAVDYVARYARPDFGHADCVELTGNINFGGKRLPDE